MKPSEFEISHSVKSFDKNIAENSRIGYFAEKRIVSKPSKISIPNFNSRNEDLNLDGVKIAGSHP